jgi:hypothetical protein
MKRRGYRKSSPYEEIRRIHFYENSLADPQLVDAQEKAPPLYVWVPVDWKQSRLAQELVPFHLFHF